MAKKLTPEEMAEAMRMHPDKAVEWMRQRAPKVTHNWADLIGAEHSHAFTVSRLTRLDLVTFMYEEMMKVYDGEQGRGAWKDRVRERLQQAGWWGTKEVLDPKTGKTVRTRFDNRRLNFIWMVNLRRAMLSQTWDNLMLSEKYREQRGEPSPMYTYLTAGDDRVRPAHAVMHGVTAPLDHPMWRVWWPPNGYRCRCDAVRLRPEELAAGEFMTSALGVKTMNKIRFDVPDVPMQEFINPRTGVISRVPKGITPGFDHNPGIRSDSMSALIEAVEEKLARAPAEFARQTARDIVHETFLPWAENADGLSLLAFFQPKGAPTGRGVLVDGSLVRASKQRPEGWLLAQYVIDHAHWSDLGKTRREYIYAQRTSASHTGHKLSLVLVDGRWKVAVFRPLSEHEQAFYQPYIGVAGGYQNEISD